MFTLNEYLNSYLPIPDEIRNFETYFLEKSKEIPEYTYHDLAWFFADIKVWNICQDKKLDIWRNDIQQELYDFVERFEANAAKMKEYEGMTDIQYEQMVCERYYAQLYLEYMEPVFTRTLLLDKFAEEGIPFNQELSYNEILFIQRFIEKEDLLYTPESSLVSYKDKIDELFETYIVSENSPGM